MIKYRVCWSADSNISFHGESEWREWEDPDATREDVLYELYHSTGGLDRCTSIAIVEAGLSWWAETEEA